jgi:hypothetical protein
MKSLLALILTKTGLVRYLVGIAASLLIGWGALKSENQEAAIASGTTLVTLIATALIERKKDGDTKKAQADIGAKPDGWFGPQSRASIPGAPYDPAVRVRRAELGRRGPGKG